MPKAVLIIDMPENCGKCPLNYDTLECIVGDAEGKLIETDYRDRPERCQLKPLVDTVPIAWIDTYCTDCDIGLRDNDHMAIKKLLQDWKEEHAGS